MSLINSNRGEPGPLTFEALQKAFDAFPHIENPPILVSKKQYYDPKFRAAAKKYLGAEFPDDPAQPQTDKDQ